MKRPGRTKTISISVDPETVEILKAEARRAYGGNVSALVAAIASEAKRQGALDWLLEGSRRMTREERRSLLAEIDGKPAKKRARRAA